MIEQERRAVDQRPGDVLGRGEPPVGAARRSSRRPAAIARAARRRTGLLRELELSAAPRASDRSAAGPGLRRRIDLPFAARRRWREGTRAGRSSGPRCGPRARRPGSPGAPRGGPGRSASARWSPRSGTGRAYTLLVVIVVQRDREHRAAGLADGLRGLERRPVDDAVVGETAQPLPPSLALPSIDSRPGNRPG